MARRKIRSDGPIASLALQLSLKKPRDRSTVMRLSADGETTVREVQRENLKESSNFLPRTGPAVVSATLREPSFAEEEAKRRHRDGCRGSRSIPSRGIHSVGNWFHRSVTKTNYVRRERRTEAIRKRGDGEWGWMNLMIERSRTPSRLQPRLDRIRWFHSLGPRIVNRKKRANEWSSSWSEGLEKGNSSRPKIYGRDRDTMCSPPSSGASGARLPIDKPTLS